MSPQYDSQELSNKNENVEEHPTDDVLKDELDVDNVSRNNGEEEEIRKEEVDQSTFFDLSNHFMESNSIQEISKVSLKTKVRLRGRVAYDGTGFQGWQYQSQGRTVQGELETVLFQRFQRTIRIVGASRTDGGVHARGQAFHFDVYLFEILQSCKNRNARMPTSYSTPTPMDRVTRRKNVTSSEESLFLDFDEHASNHFRFQLQKSLNRMLRKDVRVWNLSYAPLTPIVSVSHDGQKNRNSTCSNPKAHQEIPQGQQYANNMSDTTTTNTKSYAIRPWHAIASSKGKLYSYRISLRSALSPLQRYTRVHTYEPINIDYLRNLLKHYEGTHDFRAFAGAIEANQKKKGATALEKNTIRTVYNITLIHEDNHIGNYRIDIFLQGALYKMIRNMIGTALEVAQGKMEEEQMLQLLHQNFSAYSTSTSSLLSPHTVDTQQQMDYKPSVCNDSNRKIPLMRKDNKCKPAPPEGLTLEKVFYSDDDF